MSFGEKLTKLRKEKGLSQEDLANNLNVSRQAVSKWESNQSYPETDKILAICKLFNSSMDELIGLKEGKIKKENKILNNINDYFDRFIKGIKMFYAMTLKQKIKCLIEMCFYGIVLLCIFIIFREIFIEIIRKLLSILPNELLRVIIQIFDGLYYLIFLILSLYIIIKLYKVRYLDYYENYLEKKREEPKIIINELKSENIKKINIREEKIIIRDQDSIFKPFSWLKKIFNIIGKCFSFCGTISLSIIFVLLIALIIFTIAFIEYGLLIKYIIFTLIGALITIYIFIEIFIKYLFNMKQSPKKLFILFIFSMILIGISSGLFACELTTFKIVENKEYNTLKYKEEIKMEKNVVLNLLRYRSVDLEIVFEERDDILIELYGTEYNISPIYSYKEIFTCDNSYNNNKKEFNVYSTYNSYDYFNGKTINDFIKYILSGIKNKEIISEEDLFYIKPKLYISKDNYEIIKNNNKDFDQREYCIYE